MADVELNDTIRYKLKAAFGVDNKCIDDTVSFFNKKLKPAIKSRYLSHLVSSIEEIINEQQKIKFLSELSEAIKKSGNFSDIDFNDIFLVIRQNRIRLFSIMLVSVSGRPGGRKAKSCLKDGGIMICYDKNLTPNETRFAIAHELGHIVNEYLLKLSSPQSEYIASLFAYIALLDKNNFYQNECDEYISKTDIELFNEYMNLLHIPIKK